MNREKAEAHILALARDNRITVHWRRRAWKHFEAHPGTRMIFVGSPTTPIRYLAALHEMGHILSPAALAAQRGHQLTEEAAAWDWALDHALPELMPNDFTEIRELVGMAWSSYLIVG